MEPDRWAEERRRGMTIDLGYAWTTLPSGEVVTFVDVPGHERFMTNMLAGVGPAPAVLLVVAADEGWQQQTEEHTNGLSALGVRHGVLVVTRNDLADPRPVIAQARERLATTPLDGIDAVAVSGVTGDGLSDLRDALARLCARLPKPNTTARLRLWLDRAFTIRGSGTVVTGTLQAGQLRVGDHVTIGARQVSVRQLQSLGQPVDHVLAVARVAVNLRGIAKDEIHRGDALCTPDGWLLTRTIDARVHAVDTTRRLPRDLMLHIGSASVPVAVRMLDSQHARLALATGLPLQVGDRALLRDPGRRSILAGVDVLDPDPPSVSRRGAARSRAGTLGDASGKPSLAEEVRRRGAVRLSTLMRLGLESHDPRPPGTVITGDWMVDADLWQRWLEQLEALVERGRDDGRLLAGVPQAQLARLMDLPDQKLVAPLLEASPQLTTDGGLVRQRSAQLLPDELTRRLRPFLDRLAESPFEPPNSAELAAAGLGTQEIGAATAAGVLMQLPDGVILRSNADLDALRKLELLPQPFTASMARQALDTSRRVAVPLLELLDRKGLTRRIDPQHRVVVDQAPTASE
jgi:selenocysteine-specific elongation factor